MSSIDITLRVWDELSTQFKQLPKVIDVQTAPTTTDNRPPSGSGSTYVPPSDTTG